MNRTTKLRSLAFCGFLALLTAFPTLLAPPRAAAYGLVETETFYSDGTYSMVVGRCVSNDCTGSYTCTGTMTAFSKTTVRIC